MKNIGIASEKLYRNTLKSNELPRSLGRLYPYKDIHDTYVTSDEKKGLYLSVNVFSTKVLIGDTIFTSPIREGTAILRGHASHAKV